MELTPIDSDKTFSYTIKYTLIFIPAIIYFSFVAQYSLNLPRADDFYAILDFLNKYKLARSFDKLALLFSQHNEHRIFSSRLIYVLDYSIFGVINFKHIIYLNLFILLQIYLLVIHFCKKLSPDLYFVLAFLFGICIFDLNNFENGIFAMSGLQNYGIVLLFLASMYFYGSQQRKLISVAILLQIIAVFSSGNGNIASFFLVLFTILNKDKFKIIASVITFVLAALLYYYHYTHIESGSTSFTTDPTKFVPYFLHVIGAHFAYDLGVPAGCLLLAIAIVVFPVEKGLRIQKNAIPFVCILGFILSSVGVMSVFRGNLPINFSYSSRYLIYPHLMVPIVATLMLIKWPIKKQQLSAIITIIFIFSYSIDYAEGKMCFEAFFNSLKNEDFGYGDKDAARKITEESCRLNIYCIDKERHH